MAALTITAASVLAGSNASTENGTAGATITAGQVVYLDEATGKYGLADCNSATLGVRQARASLSTGLRMGSRSGSCVAVISPSAPR
jgi:hypothetical protein